MFPDPFGAGCKSTNWCLSTILSKETVEKNPFEVNFQRQDRDLMEFLKVSLW